MRLRDLRRKPSRLSLADPDREKTDAQAFGGP
jgi:hypothetical protein